MLVTVSSLSAIDFAPSSTAKEIIQNVQTILATPKGSVPLDRAFGVDYSFLDAPTPQSQMMQRVYIVQAIEAYEPRCKVKSITFVQDESAAMDGVLKPTVTLEISDSYA